MYTVVPGTDLEFLLWKRFRHPIINISTSIYLDKLAVHAAGRELRRPVHGRNLANFRTLFFLYNFLVSYLFMMGYSHRGAKIPDLLHFV